jgi:hypothetical protein
MNYEHWEWFKEDKEDDREVTTYSLIAGDVLCRYWGDIPKCKEAKLIENAQKLYENLKKLREWHRSEYQSNPMIDKEVDQLINIIEDVVLASLEYGTLAEVSISSYTTFLNNVELPVLSHRTVLSPPAVTSVNAPEPSPICTAY